LSFLRRQESRIKLMEIIEKYSNTADKWFDDTISNTADTIPFLYECTGAILVVAKKYTKAFFTLIENNHILPAKAMLRILGELFIKLAYCMDIEDENSNDAERINRLKRWAYHTEDHRLKGLKTCLKATEDKSELEDIQQRIMEKEDYLKQFSQSIAENKFPSTRDLFTGQRIKGLNNTSGHYLYLNNYFLYNNAIHLDMCSIGNLVKKQGGTTLIKPDASDNKVSLAQNGLYQFMCIVLFIRKYYNQDMGKVIAEYDDIMKKS